MSSETTVSQPIPFTWWLPKLPRVVALSTFYLVAGTVAVSRARPVDRWNVAGGHVVRYLIAMGPLWVKLGQVLATRWDIVPPGLIRQLRRLHDDCPPSSTAYVNDVLRRVYGDSLDSVFDSFNFKSLASGSIAQVHHATLAGGQEVAVKIVKSGVRESLAADLALARALVTLAHWLAPPLRRFHLPQHFAEVSQLLATQADLNRERRDQEEVRNGFGEHSFMRVPRTYPNLSTRDVLVMEFVDETPGRNWRSVPVAPETLAHRMYYGLCTMLHLKGVFHADPHPGNIFFTADGDVVLVDFGLVGRISEDVRWGLSSFFFACVHRRWELAAERLSRHFVKTNGKVTPPPDTLLPELADILREHFGKDADQWTTFGFLHATGRVLEQYDARLRASFAQIAVMLLTGEGFVHEIDPDFQVWKNARIFADRSSPFMSVELTNRFDRTHWRDRPRSRELRTKASGHLVAQNHLDRLIVPSQYPIFVKHAQASRLQDEDGRTLIDLASGYGPQILGYAHPAVTEAIVRAVRAGSLNGLGHAAEVALAEELTGAFTGADLTVFSNSGTEAAMQAFRMCRAFTGRNRVAKFEGHFHGWSDQGLVSSSFRFSGPTTRPAPVAPYGVPSSTVGDTLVLQYGFTESLERLREHVESLACVICEPMPAAMASCDVEFLRALRTCCDEIEVPLVFDEVITGFRVAYGGVQTLAGVEPDLTCLGKIVGGGLPCGAVVGRRELLDMVRSSGDPFLDYERRGLISGTQSGNSIVCAAGHATIAHLRDHPEIYEELNAKTAWLVDSLTDVAAAHDLPFFIRGTGSIFNLRFADSGAPDTVREHQQGSHFKANIALAYYMREHGVYMPELHFMLLNAAHTRDDLQTITDAFSKSLKQMIADGLFSAVRPARLAACGAPVPSRSSKTRHARRLPPVDMSTRAS